MVRRSDLSNIYFIEDELSVMTSRTTDGVSKDPSAGSLAALWPAPSKLLRKQLRRGVDHVFLCNRRSGIVTQQQAVWSCGCLHCAESLVHPKSFQICESWV